MGQAGAGVMTAIYLCAALILDAIFGEPKWLWSRLPHPAVLMGRAVGLLDRHLNRPPFARVAGIVALSLLVIGAGAIGWAVAQTGGLVTICVAAVLLAHRSLISHVAAAADGLRLSLQSGRTAVSHIVSRDVTTATPSAVARSAIESLSENFSDGVIAPAFWFLVGGLPGIAIYKVVNTADSMIGYRTPRHEAFGWAAARFDDVLNLVPARLCALLIMLAGGALGQVSGQVSGTWRKIRQDAALHRSPNAGWPEAAMAQALDIALAGPRSYHGTTQDFAWVNGSGKRDLGARDIEAALAIIWKAWQISLVALAILGGILWVF